MPASWHAPIGEQEWTESDGVKWSGVRIAHLNQSDASLQRWPVGVDHKTVGSQRANLESIGEIPQSVSNQRKDMESTGEIHQFPTSIGMDGKERPREVQRKSVAIFNPTPREEIKERVVLQHVEKTVDWRVFAINGEKVGMVDAGELIKVISSIGADGSLQRYATRKAQESSCAFLFATR